MAEPITWRSLASPMPQVDPARSLLFTQQALNEGFGNLNKVLEQRQATEASNWEQQKQNNTQAFLDQLAQYRTPEEMAAAQQSGIIDELRKQYGAQVDRAQIRNAAENRLATLYQQARQAGEYQDYTTDRNQLPIMEQIRALAADGSPQAVAQARALMASHPDLRHIGQAAENVFNGERATAEFGMKTETHEDQLKTSEANRRHLRNADANDAARVALQREQQQYSRFFTGLDKLGEAQTAAAATSDNLISSSKGNKQVLDTIEKMVAPGEERDALVRYVGKALADPRNKYMTVDQLVGAALNTKDERAWGTRWARDANRGETLDKQLEALRNSKEYAAQSDAYENTRTKRQNEVAQLRAALGFGDTPGALPGTPAVAGQTVVVNPSAGKGAPTPTLVAAAPAPGTATAPAATAPVVTPATAAAQFKQSILGAVAPQAVPQPETKTQVDVLMERLAQNERNRINTGDLKEFSPEVKNYLAEQQAKQQALQKLTATATTQQAESNIARLGLGNGPLPGVGPTQFVTALMSDAERSRAAEAEQQAAAAQVAEAAARKIQAAQLQAKTAQEIAARNRAPDSKVTQAKLREEAKAIYDALEKAKKAK